MVDAVSTPQKEMDRWLEVHTPPWRKPDGTPLWTAEEIFEDWLRMMDPSLATCNIKKGLKK